MVGFDDLIFGVALKYAPDVVGSVFGEKSGETARALAETVRKITGKDNPEEARAVLDGSPELRAQLQQKAMELKNQAEERAFQERIKERQLLFEEFQASLKDTANARQQNLELVKSGSIIAWGAPIVSAIVLTTFLVTLSFAFTSPSGAGGHEQLINLMAGALTTMATAVVGYWVGTSASSAQKTNLLAMSQPIGAGQQITATKKQ